MIQRKSPAYFLPLNWRIFHLVSYAVISSCIFSCQNGSREPITQPGAKEHQSPTVVVIKNPVSIALKDQPKPLTVVVPAKPVTYKTHIPGGGTNIYLVPPETKPAGFFSTMQNYTTDNGLALDAVTCSCMDHFGNLWFGTQGGGVSRYDGKSFTNFTMAQGLSNTNIFSILEDRKGNIWIGTDGGGVCRYDGKSFTTFKTVQGLGGNTIWCILEDKKGNLWFGTGTGGVSRYDGKKFTTYAKAQGLVSNDVLGMAEDEKGNIWIGTDAGVNCYDGKSFTTYTMAQGLCSNNIASTFEDKNGDLWFGTNGGGVSRYDGKTFTTYSAVQGLCNDSVLSILEDKKGNLWFGTNNGVSCYDGKSFITYTTEQGLSNNNVLTIVEDKAMNIWFGTFGSGLSRYDGKSFVNYTALQGLGNSNVASILEDKKGNLWFGTQGGGVSRYDGKSFITYTMSQGLSNNYVYSSLEDKKGNIWFGTNGGLSCYDGKSFTIYTTAQGLCNNNVWSSLEDKKGNLWFGTDGGGVSCFNGKSFVNYSIDQGLNSNIVVSIIEDKKGNLWFGTNDGGVSCFNGKSFTTYTTAQGLCYNTIASILEDKTGVLWFGSPGGGLSRYDGKSFTTYTTDQGLPDGGVACIVSDKEGNIVIGTNIGIAVLKLFAPNSRGESSQNSLPAQNNMSNEELKNYSPVFKIYNSKTGYPVKDVNQGNNNGAMICDSKGIIWAGTGSEKTALVRFDPSALNKNPNPPTVVIQDIKINKENICWYNIAQAYLDGKVITPKDSTTLAQQEVMTYGKALTAQERDTIRKRFGGIQFDGITPFYPLPENLVLPYKDNHITFDFTAIEPSKPYLVNYRYILENYDNDWSPVSKKTTAIFGNINEGTYTFKVKSQSPEGIWSQPVTYTFKVLPPVYRTWWAYSLYVIISFFLLIGIYRWRTASLRKKNVMLEQTIKQRTLEVVKQKDEAEKQKILVEEKNKDITDSINYAKRIQRALLKEEEHVSKHLPEHFILFKPKDIVSGDFYWSIEKQDYFYLAAVDCTGHGVPGGFMSMLGHAFLNEITANNVILTPAEILEALRNKILKEFKQTGTDSETKDGMDISLMRLNLKTKEIQWSGANNPLYYIVNGELKEIPPDKQPIGYYPLMKPFSNHHIQGEKDTIVYLFSDGYADQFGGPNGKKFKHSQLKEIVFSIHKNSLKDQKKILNETFEKWKGNLEQVDDVLIMGIRI